MVEVFEKAFHDKYNFRFGRICLTKCCGKLFKEGIDFSHGSGFYSGHHTQRLITVHVGRLLVGEELLVGFFAGSVAGGVVYGVIAVGIGQPHSAFDGFLFRAALHHAVSQRLQKVRRDGGEGFDLFFSQFGEENLPASPQHAGEHTDFTAFVGRDEVAGYIIRCREGLSFGDSVHPSVGQRAIAEGNVCETCRGHGEFGGVSHNHLFHDFFGASHDIDGVCGLVGRYAEVVFRGELFEQSKEFSSTDNVVFEERFDRVDIFFAADVFMGREVGYDIESSLLFEHFVEDLVVEVHRVGDELLGDKSTGCRADITRKFGESVFVDVDDGEFTGFEGENGPDKGRADGSGSPDNEDGFPLDFVGELLSVVLDVLGKHTGLPSRNVVFYELREVKHYFLSNF